MPKNFGWQFTNECVALREQTCKMYRSEKKKLQKAFRKSENRRAKDERIPAKAHTATLSRNDRPLACREFRTPMMQILYMLSKYSDDR